MPSSTYRLYVIGSAFATGSWTASDVRYKTGITDVDGSLSDLLKLEPVTYSWNREAFPEMSFDDNRHLGLIAQDVEKIFPELVNTDENGYKAVAYDRLSVVLIKGIKEQQQLIEAQQREIEELKAKAGEIEYLKAEMDALRAMIMNGNK